MPAFPPRIEAKSKAGLEGSWYVVAKSVEVKRGRLHAVKALGKRIVLWRGEDDRVRCTEDVCPHRGAPLSKGVVAGNDISCHYHGVTLDGNGTVVRVPALPKCALEGRKTTTAFAVEELADGIFVYFPSAAHPEPLPFHPPSALLDDSIPKFLCTAVWNTNWRYMVDNLLDPMHGTYLHSDTFTLSGGSGNDLMKIVPIEDGFRIERQDQQNLNFDYANAHLESAIPHVELSVPFPPAAGPGGPLELLPLATPIDEFSTRIFFWRMRKTSGLAADVWKFMWRARFEARAWFVVEQDREMLEGFADNARDREMLYQHDIGIGRLRQWITKRADEIIVAEERTKEVV